MIDEIEIVMRKLRPLHGLLLALWLAAASLAIGWTIREGAKTDPVASGAKLWPAESRIRIDERKATLLMFFHPHCSCSRASLRGLAATLERRRIPLNAFLIEVWPEGAAEHWRHTDIHELAGSIPNTTLIVDKSGFEARAFDSTTSGDVYIFSASKQLLFHGGITSSRGHEGDSDGECAVAKLLEGSSTEQSNTKVFGCQLTRRGNENQPNSGTADENKR